MRRHSILVATLLFAISATTSFAQNYRFAVPSAEVTVTIGQDGAATIDYALTFTCALGAHAIDVVDIGMPNLGPHRPLAASIDGREIPLRSVRISTVLKPRGAGYEIALEGDAITSGRTGTLHFTAREEKMVWQDTTDRSQASFRFTPTWFGSQYVQGQTALTLRYRLPIPVTEYDTVKDRILWQKRGEEFSAKGVMDDEALVSVAWARRVAFTGPHVFGVSFPRQYVTAVRKDSLWRTFYRWFSGNPQVMMYSGIFVVLAYSVVFFWLTQFTGWTVYFILLVLGLVGMVRSPGFHLALYPALTAIAVAYGLLRRHRKQGYFPARVCREGGGIKRGLTAVEAAVLLELPLSKVLTMVIFGLVRKGLLRVVTNAPLCVEVTGHESSKGVWVTVPGDTKVKLRAYEAHFLNAFRDQPRARVDSLDLAKPMDRLVMGTARVMRNFDLEVTRAYYQAIVTRAWKQVEREGNFEARCTAIDDTWDWLAMDPAWGRRLDESTRGGGTYYPRWYGGHTHRGGAGGGPAVPATATTAPTTSFADLTNSIAGQLEGVSARAASALDGFAANARGGIDLSSVDHFTGEMLKSLAEGGGSGGGFSGGGGCACACAGCACACACAGGGR